jgi:hypothetical protein
MNKKLITFAMTALLTAAPLAQSAFATDNDDHQPTIQERKHNQQRRIRQGVRSGELTKGETRHVEKQEHALNREERQMRAKDGGKLTARDRAKLDRQQNKLSKEIYKDKHNNRKRG